MSLFGIKHQTGLLLALGAIIVTPASANNNWPRWRGPDDSGSAAGNYPVQWEVEKALWRVPLSGKGFSTPIVWDRRIFLTAPTNGLDAAFAYDWSGKPQWQTTFGRQLEGRHRNGSGSNPSPVTDGQTVFVYFKSGTFAALDLDGRVKWKTNLVESFGPDTLYWDHGTSPVLTEQFVIMTRMHRGESWVAAFDKSTGVIRWKVPRNYETALEGDHGYSTPLVLKQDNRESLLLWGGEHVSLHQAIDGKEIWSNGEFGPDAKPHWPTVASLVLARDVIIVPFGRADRGSPRLHGIKLGATGDSAAAGKGLWKRTDTGTFVPTPAVHQGLVYIVRDRGEVDCLDPITGKTVWSDAFPKGSANFYASPVIAGGKLYAAREDGVVFVAKIEGKFEVLAENNMKEHVIASLVPIADRLLIRGEQHLYCIGAP